MTGSEAARIVAEMTAIWGQRELSRPETAAWRDTLMPVDVEVATAAVQWLKSEHDWFPTHNQFLIVAQEVARRFALQRALPAGPLKECELCGDTGWREVDSKSVERCRCSIGQRGQANGQSHRSGCSCFACYHGNRPLGRRQSDQSQMDLGTALTCFAHARAALHGERQ